MKSKKSIILSTVCFFITGLLIIFFFPREGKFRYQFHEGKPWRYGLLTASGDFPIYKSDNDINAAKDSVTKNFIPYFRVDSSIQTIQIQNLHNNYKNSGISVVANANYTKYIETQLKKIYEKGIFCNQEPEKENQTQIYLLKNNLAELKQTKDLSTIHSAYETIITEAPHSMDLATLKSFNLNHYLTENILYDPSISDKMLSEELQNIPISEGLVQAGERIVDRGEIVDSEIYNILRSLKIVYETKAEGNQHYGIVLLGQIILIFGILFCCGFYLACFRPDILYKKRNILFILLSILTSCLLAELSSKFDFINIYIIPFAILPIVVRIFFDSHSALFIHIITVLLCSLVAPFPYEFIILQIMAGIVVIFTLKELSERSQLVQCAFMISISYALCYLGLCLFQEGNFSKINWYMLLYFGINFVSLLFSYILIYMLEKTFGYVSSITLVELSNINSPLLKRLSETCPGTFQHSLQVSILAYEAGVRIGANAQLVRTGALYHDVGKMTNPTYFTENQRGGLDSHQKLTFEESAQIIINHVPEGVKMAEKAALPQALIDFIRTHHGTGKAKYFYNSFRNEFPDKTVNEELFTYPGPNPFTKETAILMMADAVEATSRSLNEYTDKIIKELVNRIINDQINDGLLQNSPLTFNDIGVIKAAFIERLKIMYHTRINYPDLKSNH